MSLLNFICMINDAFCKILGCRIWFAEWGVQDAGVYADIEGVVCVWAVIVNAKGTTTLTDKGVQLKVTYSPTHDKGID